MQNVIFLVLKPVKGTHNLAMIKIKPSNDDEDEEDENAKEKKGLVRKNIIKVTLEGYDYKIKMMNFQKKIKDIAVTLRFVFVALSDGVVAVDYKEWKRLDTYEAEAR